MSSEPGGRFIEPREQVDEGGFSRAGGSDDGQAGAGGNRQRDVAQDRRVAVAEIQMAELDLAAQARCRARIDGSAARSSMAGSALSNSSMRDDRGGAALEEVDHPAHGDDGPDEQDHVGVELDELADRDAMLEDQVAAGQQGDDHGDAEDELERGPEHAHELNQAQGAGDVCAIELFEEADLGFFAGEGADQPRAGVVFLGLRGDLGEAGLDALEAVVNPVAEVLHQDAGQRHGRQATRVSQGLRWSRKNSAKTVKKTVLALYMRAGPSSMRTAFRSLVMRAMTSPVR